ncbi:MAG: hypothetical protein HYS27_07260 [Deltaproteobacteria bacterium]|nr:hypothetical protein [Deltaproteobacteria bacterium]
MGSIGLLAHAADVKESAENVNAKKQWVRMSAGGAITGQCVPVRAPRERW